jgi:hypothetical protein
MIGRESLLGQDKWVKALSCNTLMQNSTCSKSRQEYLGSESNPALPETETGKYAEELSEYAVYPFYSLHDTRRLLALPPLGERIKP